MALGHSCQLIATSAIPRSLLGAPANIKCSETTGIPPSKEEQGEPGTIHRGAQGAGHTSQHSTERVHIQQELSATAGEPPFLASWVREEPQANFHFRFELGSRFLHQFSAQVRPYFLSSHYLSFPGPLETKDIS